MLAKMRKVYRATQQNRILQQGWALVYPPTPKISHLSPIKYRNCSVRRGRSRDLSYLPKQAHHTI